MGRTAIVISTQILFLILTALTSNYVYSQPKNNINMYTLESFVPSVDSSEEISELLYEVEENSEFPDLTKKSVANILALVRSGHNISVTDYVSTQYALMVYVINTEDGLSELEGTNVIMSLVEFLDTKGFAKDHAETYGIALNNLAWKALKASKPKKALELVEKGLKFANEPGQYAQDLDYSMYDTEIRALLDLNRENEAFSRVKQILPEHPNFENFHKNERYLAWLRLNK